MTLLYNNNPVLSTKIWQNQRKEGVGTNLKFTFCLHLASSNPNEK
jgi:hypothetical protein